MTVVRAKSTGILPVLSGLLMMFLSSPVWAGSLKNLPPDPNLAEHLLEMTDRDFHIRESEHFTICYDTDYAAVRSLIGRLEGTYDAIRRFSDTLKWTGGPPEHRMGVLLFGQFDAFAQYAKAEGLSAGSLAGFYSQKTNLSAFCHTLDSPSLKPILQKIAQIEKRLQPFHNKPSSHRGGGARRDALSQELLALRLQRDAVVKRINQLVIQHEVAHQMMFNVGVHVRGRYNPHWLVEGLACQFETPQTDPRGRLRRTNHMRLADFRVAIGVALQANRITVHEYQEAVRAGRWVPLVDFITNPDLFIRRDDKVIYHYAQAWALVFYLLREQTDAFSRYLQTITSLSIKAPPNRKQILQTFESAFGRADETMERTWINAMLKTRLDLREAGLD